MLNAPKMAASVDALFNKLEERFKQIPTITLQEIPKIAIFIVVSSGRRLKVSPANPSHHTLVIDLRFQDGPKIEKKYGSLDKNIKFGKARGQVVIKFDGEDTFTGILQENTNLRKLVETGAVDIHGEKKLLIKVAPLLGGLFSDRIKPQTKSIWACHRWKPK